MTHTPVTAEDLTTYAAQIERELCGHYGGGYHASLTYRVHDLVKGGMFHVYDHRELILSTTSASEAAEAYNSLRPRVVN